MPLSLLKNIHPLQLEPFTDIVKLKLQPQEYVVVTDRLKYKRCL